MYKFKKVIKKILITFFICFILISLMCMLDKLYIVKNPLEKRYIDSIKDILSMFITIMSIFWGFAVTIITLFISMCDRRLMRLIAQFNLQDEFLKRMKSAIESGIICIIIAVLVFVFIEILNVEIFYLGIIILLYTLVWFSTDFKFLLKIINTMLKTSFNKDDDEIIKR